jgi:hypothetical protein
MVVASPGKGLWTDGNGPGRARPQDFVVNDLADPVPLILRHCGSEIAHALSFF